MIFKPETGTLWDTFILPHEDRFFLFYLHLRKAAWDGYGLAVSDDLLHWKDYGPVLTLDVEGGGMGTGMVWRAGDRWLMNYSYKQNIYFAESDDLIRWRKFPPTLVSKPDPRWYEHDPNHQSGCSRWDTICVERDPSGNGFIGFVTANANEGPPGGNGVCGFVRSKDGLHWEGQPPVSVPCGMGWAEVGGHVAFGDDHYLLVSSGTGIGARFDPILPEHGRSGGCYVMHAGRIDGPYRFVDGDPLLLGTRYAPPVWAYLPCYFLRPFPLGDRQLTSFHWMPRANFLDAWLGAPKVLVQERPGKLALQYWDGCERLKGQKLFDLAEPPPFSTPTPQSIPLVAWTLKSARLHGRTQMGCGVLSFDVKLPVRDGIVIEAEVTLTGDGAAGLWFSTDETTSENPYAGVGCLVNAKGLCEFGRVAFGPVGPPFYREDAKLWPQSRHPTRWTLLVRGEFVEWYIDGRLVHCYGFSRTPAGGLGIYVERGEIELSTLRAWAFA